MDFDTTLCAIDADDQLQPGELYFVLPLRLLNSPLRTQEMRALAVKATQALNLGRYWYCKQLVRIEPPLLLNNNLQKSSFLVTHGGGGGGEGFRVRRKTRTVKSNKC
ncbi:Cysteine/Histidine-rich C1 domain family protein [Gossypium australe]|uniref:Cysteine/Histidine-rich C1 domain family protein n=1 Tax=Gossypium australe TaxID=47621 RepID=A0A5B6WW90_9ROSI|nr:Cysteine/Histidine-rich C1 domain family protein [Gossypium australe]